jgi:hypothetical protein
MKRWLCLFFLCVGAVSLLLIPGHQTSLNQHPHCLGSIGCQTGRVRFHFVQSFASHESSIDLESRWPI